MSQESTWQRGGIPAALPANEAERLRSLRSYEILDTLPESVYDDMVFVASMICQTPIALVSFVDENRQFLKANVGLPVKETPRDIAFCAHAILDTQPLVVNDAAADPRFAGNPLVVGDPGIRFYAGVPLRTPEGLALGTLCAIDRTPRELSADQHKALTALARQVMAQLELRRMIFGFEASLLEAREPAPVSSVAPVVNVDIAAERARTLLGQGAVGGPMGDRIRALLARFEALQASQRAR